MIFLVIKFLFSCSKCGKIPFVVSVSDTGGCWNYCERCVNEIYPQRSSVRREETTEEVAEEVEDEWGEHEEEKFIKKTRYEMISR